jgi:hypothetical protein
MKFGDKGVFTGPTISTLRLPLSVYDLKLPVKANH